MMIRTPQKIKSSDLASIRESDIDFRKLVHNTRFRPSRDHQNNKNKRKFETSI